MSWKCLGDGCPGCSNCDPMRNDGRFGQLMKNVTPRTKKCDLCHAEVSKRDEGVVLGRYVTCVPCVSENGKFDTVKADLAVTRIANKHGIAVGPHSFVNANG